MSAGEYNPIDDIHATDEQLSTLYDVTNRVMQRYAAYDRLLLGKGVDFYGFSGAEGPYAHLPIMNSAPHMTAELSFRLVNQTAPQAARLLRLVGALTITYNLPYVYSEGEDPSEYGQDADEPMDPDCLFTVTTKRGEKDETIGYMVEQSLEDPGSISGWRHAPDVNEASAFQSQGIRSGECQALLDVVQGWAALVRSKGVRQRKGYRWELPGESRWGRRRPDGNPR